MVFLYPRGGVTISLMMLMTMMTMFLLLMMVMMLMMVMLILMIRTMLADSGVPEGGRHGRRATIY